MLDGVIKSLKAAFSWRAKPSRSPVDAARKWQERYAKIRASYDAARTSTEYTKIWENADTFDADSAHSKEVRHTLIKRSRYEVNSNGFSDGIAQTYANDLIGAGPALRMQTGSDGFNRLIELNWYTWTRAIQFRRKLWTMAHAKHVDGESFAVLHRNPGVKHALPLDVVLYEAEQCQTPYLPYGDPTHIDGIKFDEFGNPIWYDFLDYHPGSTGAYQSNREPRRVAAEQVLHWFKMRRPGQHRGVPECSSTLNVGAAARRWREATLAAAETAADFTIFIKTAFQPDSQEMEYAEDFSQQEITKRMMTALPVGYDPYQMKAEQPTATYEAFNRSLVNEQARPKNMPYNKAACDSSSYNYASGRLDHQTYYQGLDSERDDCNDVVMNPLFNAWFDLAIVRFGWLGGDPDIVSDAAREHIWDWPKHRVADVESEANANATKLTSGQTFIHRLYTDAGMDLADDITAAAASFDVSEDDIRQRLLDITLPKPKTGGDGRSNGSDSDKAADAVTAMLRNFETRKTNGAHHG